MSNPQNLYRNNKYDLNVQIGEQSSTQKEQSNTLKRTEIISIISTISSIVSLILTFVEIDGKPLISLKSFFSLALMLSSACVFSFIAVNAINLQQRKAKQSMLGPGCF